MQRTVLRIPTIAHFALIASFAVSAISFPFVECMTESIGDATDIVSTICNRVQLFDARRFTFRKQTERTLRLAPSFIRLVR